MFFFVMFVISLCTPTHSCFILLDPRLLGIKDVPGANQRLATGWGSWLSVILSETMLVATSADLVYVRLDDG
jgi:hypothetical protein